MRGVLTVLFLLAAGSVAAFDASVWLAKRAVCAREAERLRARYAEYAAKATQPAEGVVIPLETFESGRVKTLIEAARAQYFKDEGLVWAENVKIRQYKEDGLLASEILAERCLIDKETKNGWAEGPATVRHGKTEFRGRGVYFSSADSYVRAVSACEIDSKDLKFGGMRQ